MSAAIYKSCVVRCVKIVSSGLFVVNLCIHQIRRKDSSRIASYSILDAYKIEYTYVCTLYPQFVQWALDVHMYFTL